MKDPVAEVGDGGGAIDDVGDAFVHMGKRVARLEDGVVKDVEPTGSDVGAEQRCGVGDGEEADHEGDVEARARAGECADIGVEKAAARGDAVVIGQGAGVSEKFGTGVDAGDARRESASDLDGEGAFAAGEVEDAQRWRL